MSKSIGKIVYITSLLTIMFVVNGVNGCEITVFDDKDAWSSALGGGYDLDDLNDLPDGLNPTRPGTYKLDKTLSDTWSFDQIDMSTVAASPTEGWLLGVYPPHTTYSSVTDIDGTKFLQAQLRDRSPSDTTYRDLSFQFPSQIYGFGFDYALSTAIGDDNIDVSVLDNSSCSVNLDLIKDGASHFFGVIFSEATSATGVKLNYVGGNTNYLNCKLNQGME